MKGNCGSVKKKKKERKIQNKDTKCAKRHFSGIKCGFIIKVILGKNKSGKGLQFFMVREILEPIILCQEKKKMMIEIFVLV